MFPLIDEEGDDFMFPFGGGGGGAVSPVTALGLAMQTCFPWETTNNTSVGEGQIFFGLMSAPVSQQITRLGLPVDQAGVTPGAGINGCALYSANATDAVLLAQTADMTSAFESVVPGECAEGLLTEPFNQVAGTPYYFAVSANFTGTALRVFVQGAATIGPYNGFYLYPFLGSQSVFPASFDPSAAAQLGVMLCGYAR
jgi:hypothetical protein